MALEAIKTTPYQVLFSEGPSWEVGAGTDDVIPGSHYPEDYRGRVVGVFPEDFEFAAGDLRGMRSVAQINLTAEQRESLRRRESKVVAGRVEAVTLEDRWGQVAVGLRARWGEQAEEQEALSMERVAAERDAGDLRAIAESDFDEEVSKLKAAMPQMITHSGAGLYEVGPGKTYATIQGALDQLWTDQGSATFTASQYVRVFADTYDENIEINSSFNPDATNGYQMILEGDPGDDRDNIFLDTTGGARAINARPDTFIIRHMKVRNGTGDDTIEGVGNVNAFLDDMHVIMTSASYYAVRATRSIHITNSLIETAGSGIRFDSTGTVDVPYTIRRTQILKTGAVSNVGVFGGYTRIEGCVIGGFATGVSGFVDDANIGPVLVHNCTFYDCTTALTLRYALQFDVSVINNIFKDCTTNISVTAAPEETSTKIGTEFVLRNNCYHGYTNFASVASVAKTYAQFIAYGLVNNSGELDDTNPLLTDPSNDDFSLQVGSPCRNTGHSSGSVTDYLGTAFDPNEPDIGAWASGVLGAISAPTWTANTSNIAAAVGGASGEIDCTWDAATQAQGKDVGYIVEYRTTVGPGAWTEAERSVDTSLTVSNLINDTSYDFRVKVYARVEGEPTTTPVDTDTATPTILEGPSTPVIANAVDDETGTSATLTLTAGDGTDVLSVRYKALGETAWTLFGSTRVGSGDLQITGLTTTRYDFIATAAQDGVVSLPSDPALLWITDGATSASGYDRVHSLLNQQLAVVQAANVAFENSEYAKTVGTGWLRETLLPAEPLQADLGDAGRNRLQGIYQIDVFEEPGKGSNEAETMVEQLLTAFKRGTVLSGGDITVRVERAWRSPAVQEDDRYQIPVTVQWFAYVAN
jgi:hypothetical protein